MEVYAAIIDDMDQGIGRIVKSLKEKGEFDNTVILFFRITAPVQKTMDFFVGKGHYQS